MVQVIQIKRKTTGPGVPATLAPGELAYNTAGHNLVIGDGSQTVQNLVSNTRQVELAGAQTITGAKQIDVTLLKLMGGAANNLVATDGAGNLSFTPPVAASQAFVGSFDASAGTVVWVAGTGTGNALPAAAAGNKGWYLIADTAGSTPPTGTIVGGTAYEVGDWIISSGTGWSHLEFGGSAVSTASDVGVAPAVDGATNVQAALEGLNTTKMDVAAAAVIANNFAVWDTASGQLVKDGGASVATINAAIALKADAADLTGKADITYVDSENADQDAVIATKGDVFGPATAAVGNIATYANANGKTIQDGGIAIASLPTTGYIDTADALRVLKAGDTMTGPLVLPAAAPTLGTHAANKTYVDTKGDVIGPAAALVDNIATFNAVTGKTIKDSAIPISSLASGADMATADALRVLKAGDTMTGALVLPIAAPTLDTHATNKKYVDDGLAGVAAGASVLVTAPELTGNGLTGSAITFTGITHAASAPGDVADASGFKGTGLSTDPLILLVVDGGTYA